MYICVICRYHEIATKGNNRNMFEKCLVENIRRQLKCAGVSCRVLRVRGRVWLEPENGSVFESAELDKIIKVMPDVFGLQSFSPAVLLKVDMDEIKKCVQDVLPGKFAKYTQNGHKPSFRIRARRSNKRFPMTSKDIEIELITFAAGILGLLCVLFTLCSQTVIERYCTIR